MVPVHMLEVCHKISGPRSWLNPPSLIHTLPVQDASRDLQTESSALMMVCARGPHRAMSHKLQTSAQDKVIQSHMIQPR